MPHCVLGPVAAICLVATGCAVATTTTSADEADTAIAGTTTSAARGTLADTATTVATTSASASTPTTTSTTTSTATTTTGPPVTVPSAKPGDRSDLHRARARIGDDGVPVFEGDFADPYVLIAEGSFWAYSTARDLVHIPTLRAEPGSGGGYVGDALTGLPAWSEFGYTWAPAVAPVGDGYVLWYTTRHSSSRRQCISVATSSSPAGPFVDDTTEPLICALDEGGSIDPSPIVDEHGDLWLLWKSDGNCCGLPTTIYVQPLTPDGLAVAGPPVPLITNDLGWEGDVVEAPSMLVDDGGIHHLFYSANRWDSAAYAVGHATCESVTGPCTKDPEPWIDSSDGVHGPGGLEAVATPNGSAALIVHHAWTDSGVGYDDGARSLFVSILPFPLERP